MIKKIIFIISMFCIIAAIIFLPLYVGKMALLSNVLESPMEGAVWEWAIGIIVIVLLILFVYMCILTLTIIGINVWDLIMGG